VSWPYRRSRRAKPILENRADPALEAAVVELAIEQPGWGQLRVSNELKKGGQSISAFGVRGVAASRPRNIKKRLKALKAKMAQEGLVLTKAEGHSAGEGQSRQRNPWRIRQRMPRVSRSFVLSCYCSAMSKLLSQTLTSCTTDMWSRETEFGM
jgi:hypothetical protein